MSCTSDYICLFWPHLFSAREVSLRPVQHDGPWHRLSKHILGKMWRDCIMHHRIRRISGGGEQFASERTTKSNVWWQQWGNNNIPWPTHQVRRAKGHSAWDYYCLPTNCSIGSQWRYDCRYSCLQLVSSLSFTRVQRIGQDDRFQAYPTTQCYINKFAKHRCFEWERSWKGQAKVWQLFELSQEDHEVLSRLCRRQRSQSLVVSTFSPAGSHYWSNGSFWIVVILGVKRLIGASTNMSASRLHHERPWSVPYLLSRFCTNTGQATCVWSA